MNKAARMIDTRGLTELIHDKWIDLEQVVLDTTRKTLKCPIYRHGRDSIPELRVIISGVRSIEIKDTEGIGRYDIKCVSYDSATGKMLILGNIPLRINIALLSTASISILD